MTITTRDSLISALGNNNSRLVIDKATIASQTANTCVSMWRATGIPGQGAIPAATTVNTNADTGALPFNQQTAPSISYAAYAEFVSSISAMTVEIHDRIASMGGLNGTLTTAQTTSIDLSTLLSTSNVQNRIGLSDYSEVQWWVEWYTATGSTATTLTVNVTMNDGSTSSTSLTLAATRPASLMIPIPVPTDRQGKYIRAVSSVTLTASTGTAGSFGITATRPRIAMGCPLANMKFTADWAQLGLQQIDNNACLFPIVRTSATSTGTLRGVVKLAHG